MPFVVPPRPTVTAEAPAELLLAELGVLGQRVLLHGESGTGKSTLARRLAAALADRGARSACLGADPGSPTFGPPGAASLAEWTDGGWSLLAVEPIGSLDAVRFRLPLGAAVARLAARAPAGTLFVELPGAVRGAAAAELLLALAAASGAGRVVSLLRAGRPLAQAAELAVLAVPVVQVGAAPAARAPTRRARARARTEQWDAWLAPGVVVTVDLDALPVLGTPPPCDAPAAWVGRQVVLRARDPASGHGLGEIGAADGRRLTVRMRDPPPAPGWLEVRDAGRDADGRLGTVAPLVARAARDVAADLRPGPAHVRDPGPRPVEHAGSLVAVLVNGVLGDPLLHLRLRHRRRSLLVDLGDSGRLPARTVHQVSDVFLSHAHFDHIAGFIWLLRSRVGVKASCRVFGPPGTAEHVEALVRGIRWDRVGPRGPRFEVAELDGERLVRFTVQAGGGQRRRLADGAAPGGVLLDEPELRVRATVLDHGIPVLAFAVETPGELRVRRERLAARGVVSGPWLGALRRSALAGELDAWITLPDGSRERAGTLAKELLLARPGRCIAYATDLADHAENRRRLVALAGGADVPLDADQRLEPRHLARQAGRSAASTTAATSL
jgi:ribonuclease Z